MADGNGTAANNLPQLRLRSAARAWRATADRTWTIGRANEADIRSENPRVAPDHAVLEPTPAGWVLVNHSNNGMFVNGQRVERLTISQPVTVMLGSASCRRDAADSSPSAWYSRPPRKPSAPGPTPRTTSGARAATATRTASATAAATATCTATLATATFGPQRRRTQSAIGQQIGRETDNDVVLDDLLVSRHHAILRRSGDQWELADNNSANGTYVNGNRINERSSGPTTSSASATSCCIWPATGWWNTSTPATSPTRRSTCGWSPTRARCCWTDVSLRPAGALLHGGRGAQRRRENPRCWAP